MNEQQQTRIRTSDAEREQVAEAVRHAMAEGRLTLTEGEQRLADVYATTYQDELPRLTADLPPAAGADQTPRRPHQSRRRPAVGLAAAGAVAAGIWAVAAGGPLWPAIVLGVVAVMLAKHTRFGQHHGHGGCAAARSGTGQ